MADSRILNQAARILHEVQAGTPADQALRAALVQDRHFTAPVQRRQVSRAVFAYFRWWRWLDEKISLQKQLAGALELQDRFNRSPAAFKPQALAARAVPDWLAAEMELAPAWLRQLQREPALWIRTKRGFETKVTAALGNCAPAASAPGAMRLPSTAFRYSGNTDLYRTPSFQAGEFEIQDLASQLVGAACAPQPGETWWDACAGEGGKTMHLADLMENKGMLWASDRSARRLAKLKERAARAKVFNYRAAPWEGDAKLPTKTKFDGILVDAPCSGVGTWQRNPHARWTTHAHDVTELAAVQQRLLHHVAGALKSGGRLIYSVCTLTRSETSGVSEAFSMQHPEFAPCALDGLGIEASTIVLQPQELDANGMYLSAWRKR